MPRKAVLAMNGQRVDVVASNVGCGKGRLGGIQPLPIAAFLLSFLLLFPYMSTTKPIIMAILHVKAFCFLAKISE